MEVRKKAILSASQKPTRIKSHVIRDPTDRDPYERTFFGSCRIDLERKGCRYEQRQLDVEQIDTNRGRQGNSADTVKFVTKVSIKKNSPKLRFHHEQVYDHENCQYVEGNGTQKELAKTKLNDLSVRKSVHQFSAEDEQQNNSIYSKNCHIGLLCKEGKGRHIGCLPSTNTEYDSHYFICDQDKTDQTGLTENNAPGKIRQTSYSLASGHPPVRKEMENSLCPVCAVEEIVQNSLQHKTWSLSLMNNARDKTRKSGSLEKMFDETSDFMAGQTSLFSKRYCSAPSRDKLSSSMVGEKIGETDLSSDSFDRCCSSFRHELIDDVTPKQSRFSTKDQLPYLEEPDFRSSSRFSSRSNGPLCYVEEFGILTWAPSKTACVTSRSSYTYVEEPHCKASQTSFPSKRSLHLPSVSLLDGFANVDNEHIHSGHFPNRLQAPNTPVFICRSPKVESEEEINHLVRSLSKKLTTDKILVKNHCRPALYAAPTIGEINLLKKAPGIEGNSQRERARSMPSVSRPHTIEDQPRIKAVDCNSYNQGEACETRRICCSRCSTPSSIPC